MPQLAAAPLNLSESEKAELEKPLRRSSTSQQIAMRAKIILRAARMNRSRDRQTKQGAPNHALHTIRQSSIRKCRSRLFLVDNAIDAMDGKGSLKVKTARDGTFVCVEIADSGTGIPLEIQSRIFESFFTTKPVGQGTGLGLDIVRRIVENRHQGTIVLESQPGETRFSIRLPLPVTSLKSNEPKGRA